MSKFGNKFNCWKCTTKFYDLKKARPKCPKCGASPDDDPNKGMPVAATPNAADDFTDDVDEDVPAEAPDEEDADDDVVEDEAPEAPDDY